MAINTVNPNDVYNKNNFVKAMRDLGELEKIMTGIKEDPWNPEYRATLNSFEFPDAPVSYANLTPDAVRVDTERAHSHFSENIRGYAKKNFKELLDKLDAETLLALVQRVPYSVKTGISELDNLIEVINNKRKVEAILNGRGSLEGYVSEKMEKAADWRKEAFAYNQYDQNYVQRTFQAYARDAEFEFIKSTTREVTKNGKKVRELDRDKLYRLIKVSYEKIKRERGEDSKEAQMYQVGLAGTAYAVLTKDSK